MPTSATSDSTKPPPPEANKTSDKVEKREKSGPEKVEVSKEDKEKLLPPLVQTPDDAVLQYLRGQIDEAEFRKALAVYGVTTLYQAGRTERIDASYENKIPDDLLEAPDTPYNDPEYRKEVSEKKQEERDAASKAAEGETREETVEREAKSLDARLSGQEPSLATSSPATQKVDPSTGKSDMEQKLAKH